MNSKAFQLFTPPISYCIDANYFKGTTIQQYLAKCRRQLVVVDDMNNVVVLGNVNPSGRGMNGAVYDSVGLCPTLTTNKGEGVKVKLNNSNIRVRKLTPKECWRLMGFDDQDYERARSRMNENLYNGNDRCGSQMYKQAGNSIVVDVLLHIMENLYDAMPYLFEDMTVGSFFSGIGAFEKALTRLDPVHISESTGDIPDLELKQLGYINDYNGDANRIYDGSTISRALKAEAGGGGCENRMVQRPAA